MSAIRGPQSENTENHSTPKPSRITKNLRCGYCEKSFSRNEHLLRHERSSHTKDRPFKCPHCESDFSRKDIMLRHLLKMHNIVGQRSSHVAPSSSSMINRVVSLQSPLSTISFESPAAISGGVESSTTTASRTAKYPQIVKEADVNSLHRSSDYPPPKLHQPWWLEEDLNLEAADTLLFDRNGLDEPWFKPDGGRSSAPDHSLEAPYTEMGLKQMGAHISSQQNRVQKAWFTYAKESRSTDTEQLVERTQPGDRPAAGVVLDPVSSVGSYKLPSTQFLNLSVRAYFIHFAPVFPVIHSHTFRPSRENSFSLLVICSIGSLFVGPGAVTNGEQIFEKFNKTLLATWESTLLTSPTEAVLLIQAAFLGQIFGLLTGIPKHLAIVEALHGTIISWARRCNLFSHRQQDTDLTNLSDTSLEEAWRTWAKSESTLRIVIGLYILDAHLASIFHHDPLLRHDNAEIQRATDDRIFDAATALEWKHEMDKSKHAASELPEILPANTPAPGESYLRTDGHLRNNSRYTAYLSLQSISARVSELQMRDQLHYDSNSFKELQETLIYWYFKFQSHNEKDEGVTTNNSLCLMTLWHATFMNLLTNFDKLERALGREGSSIQSLGKNVSYAATWAASVSADRCILHAQVIQQTLSEMRLDANPAIHVPHCAFIAGIACYSVMRFRHPSMRIGFASPRPPITPRSPSEFPEFNLHNRFTREHLASPAPILFENPMGEPFMRTIGEPRMVYRVGADIYRQCVNLLERMGQCGYARRYGATLLALDETGTEY